MHSAAPQITPFPNAAPRCEAKINQQGYTLQDVASNARNATTLLQIVVRRDISHVELAEGVTYPYSAVFGGVFLKLEGR